MEETRPHWVMVLVLTAGELAFALVALPLYLLFVLPKYPAGEFPGFVPALSPDVSPAFAALAVAGAIAACIGLVALLTRVFGARHFQIDEVDELVREYSTAELALVYAAAGFAEEFLFRVTIMDWLGLTLFGLVVSSLLFTVVHAAYWRKPLMLVYVFAAGLAMGLLYLYTKSLLACAIAHAAYNLAVSLLLRSGALPLDNSRTTRSTV